MYGFCAHDDNMKKKRKDSCSNFTGRAVIYASVYRMFVTLEWMQAAGVVQDGVLSRQRIGDEDWGDCESSVG